jgi:hypothetical protein
MAIGRRNNEIQAVEEQNLVALLENIATQSELRDLNALCTKLNGRAHSAEKRAQKLAKAAAEVAAEAAEQARQARETGEGFTLFLASLTELRNSSISLSSPAEELTATQLRLLSGSLDRLTRSGLVVVNFLGLENNDLRVDFINIPRAHQCIIKLFRKIANFFAYCFGGARNKSLITRTLRLKNRANQAKLEEYRAALALEAVPIKRAKEALADDGARAKQLLGEFFEMGQEQAEKGLTEARGRNQWLQSTLEACLPEADRSSILGELGQLNVLYERAKKSKPDYDRVHPKDPHFLLKLECRKEEVALKINETSLLRLSHKQKQDAYQLVIAAINKSTEELYSLFLLGYRKELKKGIINQSMDNFVAVLSQSADAYEAGLNALQADFDKHQSGEIDKAEALRLFLANKTVLPVSTNPDFNLSECFLSLCEQLSANAKTIMFDKKALPDVLGCAENFSGRTPEQVIDLVIAGLRWQEEDAARWEKVGQLHEELSNLDGASLRKLEVLRELKAFFTSPSDDFQGEAKQAVGVSLGLNKRIRDTKIGLFADEVPFANKVKHFDALIGMGRAPSGEGVDIKAPYVMLLDALVKCEDLQSVAAVLKVGSSFIPLTLQGKIPEIPGALEDNAESLGIIQGFIALLHVVSREFSSDCVEKKLVVAMGGLARQKERSIYESLNSDGTFFDHLMQQQCWKVGKEFQKMMIKELQAAKLRDLPAISRMHPDLFPLLGLPVLQSMSGAAPENPEHSFSIIAGNIKALRECASPCAAHLLSLQIECSNKYFREIVSPVGIEYFSKIGKFQPCLALLKDALLKAYGVKVLSDEQKEPLRSVVKNIEGCVNNKGLRSWLCLGLSREYATKALQQLTNKGLYAYRTATQLINAIVGYGDAPHPAIAKVSCTMWNCLRLLQAYFRPGFGQFDRQEFLDEFATFKRLILVKVLDLDVNGSTLKSMYDKVFDEMQKQVVGPLLSKLVAGKRGVPGEHCKTLDGLKKALSSPNFAPYVCKFKKEESELIDGVLDLYGLRFAGGAQIRSTHAAAGSPLYAGKAQSGGAGKVQFAP